MKQRKLGRGGPIVSAIGLGCMGMSDFLKRKSSLLLPLSPLLFAAVVSAPPRHHSVTYGLPNPERWRMNVVSPSPQ
jgi:hypothetical protein